jgi:hypothetical protein
MKREHGASPGIDRSFAGFVEPSGAAFPSLQWSVQRTTIVRLVRNAMPFQVLLISECHFALLALDEDYQPAQLLSQLDGCDV